MKGQPDLTSGSSLGQRELGDGGVEVGMRRVQWVRITMNEDGPACELVGVGHRLPVVRRVPLRTAAALTATGVPVVVRRAAGSGRRHSPVAARVAGRGDGPT